MRRPWRRKFENPTGRGRQGAPVDFWYPIEKPCWWRFDPGTRQSPALWDIRPKPGCSHYPSTHKKREMKGRESVFRYFRSNTKENLIDFSQTVAILDAWVALIGVFRKMGGTSWKALTRRCVSGLAIFPTAGVQTACCLRETCLDLRMRVHTMSSCTIPPVPSFDCHRGTIYNRLLLSKRWTKRWTIGDTISKVRVNVERLRNVKT